jgi:hypothetical protein
VGQQQGLFINEYQFSSFKEKQKLLQGWKLRQKANPFLFQLQRKRQKSLRIISLPYAAKNNPQQ